MTENRATFKDAITKYMHIGASYYNGHYNDNAINIFNDLPVEDKKALLRGLSSIFLMIEEGNIPTSLEETIQQAVRRKMEDRDNQTKILPKVLEEEIEVSKTIHSSIGVFIVFGLFLVCMLGLISVIVLIGTDPDPSLAYKGIVAFMNYFL